MYNYPHKGSVISFNNKQRFKVMLSVIGELERPFGLRRLTLKQVNGKNKGNVTEKVLQKGERYSEIR